MFLSLPSFWGNLVAPRTCLKNLFFFYLNNGIVGPNQSYESPLPQTRRYSPIREKKKNGGGSLIGIIHRRCIYFFSMNIKTQASSSIFPKKGKIRALAEFVNMPLSSCDSPPPAMCPSQLLCLFAPSVTVRCSVGSLHTVGAQNACQVHKWEHKWNPGPEAEGKKSSFVYTAERL